MPNVMKYQEFVEQVRKDIRERLPGVEVVARQVEKLQGEGYLGICIQKEKSDVGVSMNLQGAFDAMIAGTSYEETFEGVFKSLENALNNRPNISAEELSDYGTMRKRLMLQVVSTAANQEMLTDIPHLEREDMSIVYRFVFDNNEEGMASALVTNQMLDNFGITAEQLHEDAAANASEKFPARVRTMQEVLAEMMGVEMYDAPEEPKMYVATCNGGVFGAGCIFYPNFMNQAADLIQGDFYILPSSVHECLLIPDNGERNSRELEAMVREINASEVQPKDQLTNSVYHYDSQNRIFEKAEKFENRMKENENNTDEINSMGGMNLCMM